MKKIISLIVLAGLLLTSASAFAAPAAKAAQKAKTATAKNKGKAPAAKAAQKAKTATAKSKSKAPAAAMTDKGSKKKINEDFLKKIEKLDVESQENRKEIKVGKEEVKASGNSTESTEESAE